MQSAELIKNIKDIVLKVIKTSSGLEIDVEADDPLVNNGLIDSMSMVRLIQELIEKFNVQVDVSEMTLENFDTIKNMASFISQKLSSEE